VRENDLNSTGNNTTGNTTGNNTTGNNTAGNNTAGNNTAGNNTTGGAASHLDNVVHPDAASAHFTDNSDKSSGVELQPLRQVGLDGLLEELPSNAPVGGKNTEQQAK
jgi:hypothetical protein